MHVKVITYYLLECDRIYLCRHFLNLRLGHNNPSHSRLKCALDLLSQDLVSCIPAADLQFADLLTLQLTKHSSCYFFQD